MSKGRGGSGGESLALVLEVADINSKKEESKYFLLHALRLAKDLNCSLLQKKEWGNLSSSRLLKNQTETIVYLASTAHTCHHLSCCSCTSKGGESAKARHSCSHQMGAGSNGSKQTLLFPRVMEWDPDEDDNHVLESDISSGRRRVPIFRPPTARLLRQWNRFSQNITAAHKKQKKSTTSAPATNESYLCHAILVAADAMHRRKSALKVSTIKQEAHAKQNHIVVLANAIHPLHLSPSLASDFHAVVAGLRKMQCAVHIVGFNLLAPDEHHEGQNLDRLQTVRTENTKFFQSLTDLTAGVLIDATRTLLPNLSRPSGSARTVQVAPILQLTNQVLQATGFSAHQGVTPVYPKHQDNDNENHDSKNEPSCPSILFVHHKTPTKSTKRKITLRIAPHLDVDATYAILVASSKLPTLKREAIPPAAPQSDDEEHNQNDNDPHKDKNSSEIAAMIDKSTNDKHNKQQPATKSSAATITSSLTTITTYWDAQDPNLEVDLNQRATAYRYGSDLVPMSLLDVEGLKSRASPSISILGYVPRQDVPREFFMGTSTFVVGACEKSSKAKVAISALATGLFEMDQVGLCSFVKSKDADPVIGALFPYFPCSGEAKEGSRNVCRRLFFVQLPFAEDVAKITLPPIIPLDEESSTTEACTTQTATAKSTTAQKKIDVADDLINALMLPDDTLCSDQIDNPSILCAQATLIDRSCNNHKNTNTDIDLQEAGGQDSRPPIVRPIRRKRLHDTSQNNDKADSDNVFCSNDEQDPMATPMDVVQRAQPCLETFQSTFPIVSTSEELDDFGVPLSSSRAKRRRKKFWTDEVLIGMD